jgi:hypothetical protein
VTRVTPNWGDERQTRAESGNESEPKVFEVFHQMRPTCSALPEGAKTLLRHNLPRRINDTRVRGLSTPRHHLQPRLDHIGRRHQRRGRHTRNGTGHQQRQRMIVPEMIGGENSISTPQCALPTT